MAADRAVQVRTDPTASVRKALDEGSLSAEAHVREQLARLASLEPQVQAWVRWDAERALEQARRADARLSRGERGPLLGLTVGLKDIIDTADFPTEHGTALHAGRQPAEDARLVKQLREAGAVILGKTVTTELATYAPGKTRNPHRLTHTPGGSSSGSAAAVACGMVDLAIGSQTNGSTIRPGSYCGVASFKPTQDRIDRKGMLIQSPSFDTVGLFAADVNGLMALYRGLHEPETRTPDAVLDANAPSRRLPHMAWWCGPLQQQLEDGVEDELMRWVRQWGAREDVQRPPCDLMALIKLHGFIMEAEIARSFANEFRRGGDLLSASLRGQIQRGQQTSDVELESALTALEAQRHAVDRWMHEERIDALLMPSAPGAAPVGLDSTGNPIFCTMATALNLPALQLPVGFTADGMPIGMQVVGARHSDVQILTLGMQLQAAKNA